MCIYDFKMDLEALNIEFCENQEKDIVIESKKVIIEYCVFKQQCEAVSGRHRSYHLTKQNNYVKKGYSFYVVFEDEYLNKKAIVISRIKNLLNKNDGKKVYARQCEVREIPTKVSTEFINKFHIQGNSGSRIKLGLFFNDDSEEVLIAVMTFGVLSRAKGNKNVQKDAFELVRFCTNNNYRSIGAAGKLLKYFERNYTWSSILSFADKRWSASGNLYKQIGFELCSITQPNYYYLNYPDFSHRVHRFAFRRDVLRERAKKETKLSEDEILSMTEFELAKTLGYDRIWDCGNYKFLKTNDSYKA